MAAEAYKDFYVQGLQALKAASDQGKGDTGDTAGSVTSPELKEVMNASSKILAQHADNIAQLLRKAGGDPNGMKNVIMEGIRAGAGQIIGAAKDSDIRDASVITASQIAVHYYIAAYGSLASTAKHLGLDEDAQMFSRMTDEMKAGDKRLTEIAEGQANKRATS